MRKSSLQNHGGGERLMSERNISIFKYISYRSFLNDFFIAHKKEKYGFSIRMWSKQLGFKSPATLNMILRGHRNPGIEAQEKLAQYFKFSGREKEYFYELVRLERFRDNEEIRFNILKRIQKLNPNDDFKIIDFDLFSIISNWYVYAIREMINSKNFKEGPQWIANKLNNVITVAQVKEALNSLERSGMVERADNGRLKVTNAQISTPFDIANEAGKCFHEEMISKAKESIRNCSPDKRDISAITFNMDLNDLEAFKKDIIKFRRSLYRKYENLKADNTYQLNIQLFPLTRVKQEYYDEN